MTGLGLGDADRLLKCVNLNLINPIPPSLLEHADVLIIHMILMKADYYECRMSASDLVSIAQLNTLNCFEYSTASVRL